jgi:hypothetical protein
VRRKHQAGALLREVAEEVETLLKFFKALFDLINTKEGRVFLKKLRAKLRPIDLIWTAAVLAIGAESFFTLRAYPLGGSIANQLVVIPTATVLFCFFRYPKAPVAAASVIIPHIAAIFGYSKAERAPLSTSDVVKMIAVVALNLLVCLTVAAARRRRRA